MSKENASTDLVLSAASRQPASSLSLSIDLIKSRDFADTQRRHDLSHNILPWLVIDEPRTLLFLRDGLESSDEALDAPNPASVDQNHSISTLASIQMLRIESLALSPPASLLQRNSMAVWMVLPYPLSYKLGEKHFALCQICTRSDTYSLTCPVVSSMSQDILPASFRRSVL